MPPSITTQATTAIQAGAAFLQSGGKWVTREVREDRLSECRACPVFKPPTRQCGDCGCFLSIKSWLPAEKCPRGKWATSLEPLPRSQDS